ncbi:MAG: ArsC family reductase [Azovibrio sp.]
MKIKVFGIKNCDTMKKAFTWLDTQGIDFEFIDYKKVGLAEKHLPEWVRQAGWEALLNTRGLTWRKLPEEDRADMDKTKAIKLMAQHPTLIKRPVLDTGTTLIVGFDPEKYAMELK